MCPYAEELLAEISAAVGCPVAVSEVRSHIMHLAGVPKSAFTLEQGGDRLRLMPRSQVTLTQLAELNRVTPTMAIVASGALSHPLHLKDWMYYTGVRQWERKMRRNFVTMEGASIPQDGVWVAQSQ